MVTRTLTVTSNHGLTARAAAAMVFRVDKFSSQVLVNMEGRIADARSILDLLLLGASPGRTLEVTASGQDEELAIAAVTALLLESFSQPVRS